MIRRVQLRTRYTRLLVVALLVLGICAAGVGALTARSAVLAPGDVTLTCPHVASPTDGQQVTCTYHVEVLPPTTTTTAPPTTTTTTPPASPPFPTAATTGVPAGTNLQVIGGDDYTTVADNQVIDAKKMNALIVRHQNVRVVNSEVTTAVMMDGGSLTIEHSTIGPATCGADSWLAAAIEGGGNYTAKYVHIRGHEDGFKAGGSNIRIEESYVDICGHAGGHSDGVQDYPPANGLVFNHNTIEARGESGVNAGIFINSGDQGGAVSTNVTITNNLVTGGGYTVYLWPGTGTWTVTGNRVVNGTWSIAPYHTGGRCAHIDSYGDNDVVTIDGGFAVTATMQDNVPCP